MDFQYFLKRQKPKNYLRLVLQLKSEFTSANTHQLAEQSNKTESKNLQVIQSVTGNNAVKSFEIELPSMRQNSIDFELF